MTLAARQHAILRRNISDAGSWQGQQFDSANGAPSIVPLTPLGQGRERRAEHMRSCVSCRGNPTMPAVAGNFRAWFQEIGPLAQDFKNLTDGIKECSARAILPVDDMSEMR